eukprot:6893751-Alexandrium_andersonii.AAC.2
MLATHAVLKTRGHGEASQRLLGRCCPWAKSRQRASCPSATCPRERATGPALRNCRCVAGGFRC